MRFCQLTLLFLPKIIETYRPPLEIRLGEKLSFRLRIDFPIYNTLETFHLCIAFNFHISWSGWSVEIRLRIIKISERNNYQSGCDILGSPLFHRVTDEEKINPKLIGECLYSSSDFVYSPYWVWSGSQCGVWILVISYCTVRSPANGSRDGKRKCFRTRRAPDSGEDEDTL